jgi:hypothetical protein
VSADLVSVGLDDGTRDWRMNTQATVESMEEELLAHAAALSHRSL